MWMNRNMKQYYGKKYVYVFYLMNAWYLPNLSAKVRLQKLIWLGHP
jgi:hypothetical protein